MGSDLNNKRKKRSQVATVKRSQVATVKRSRVSDSEKIAGKRQKEIVYKYL